MTNNKGAWHIRAGTRTELDKQVREIMAALPEGINVSEFIKECIIKANQHDKEVAAQSEMEKFKAEVRAEIRKLNEKIVVGALTGAPVEEMESDKDALNEAVSKLQALESDW